MMCIKPATRKDGGSFPCGQCVSCRVNKKRVWIARCLLETASHKANYFLTLTMEVPREQVAGIYETYLSKYYLQCFFKRLAKRFPGVVFKHFARGEYGEQKGRAHYHVLLWSSCAGITKSEFESLWRHGQVDVGDIQPASIDYVVDYILELSEVCSDVFSSPAGRSAHPDFRIISQGIGKAAVPHLSVRGVLHNEFRLLGRQYPVGRYLKIKHLNSQSITEFFYEHGYIPIASSQDQLLEQALFEQLRSLSPDTPAYEEAREKIIQQKNALSEERQKRKQIAYYRSINQPVKGRKNETF